MLQLAIVRGEENFYANGLFHGILFYWFIPAGGLYHGAWWCPLSCPYYLQIFYKKYYIFLTHWPCRIIYSRFNVLQSSNKKYISPFLLPRYSKSFYTIHGLLSTLCTTHNYQTNIAPLISLCSFILRSPSTWYWILSIDFGFK